MADTTSDFEVARYGLRTFKASLNVGGLHSVAVTGRHWENGTCEAKCLKNDPLLQGYGGGTAPRKHVSPHRDCTCGIYASLSWGHLYHQYPGWTLLNTAVIAAEGQTIIGSRGFRTQFARVVGFWTKNPDIQAIAIKQFPDAVFHTTSDQLLDAFGIDRVSAVPVSPDTWSGWPGGMSWWKEGE